MARLAVPIQGRLVREGGRLTTPYGHDRESPFWQAAEIGFLESEAAADEAVAEALRRGWILGVHYPLVQAHPWDWAPFWLAPEEDVRRQARTEAKRAVRRAANLGAAYILLHYPWPAVVDPSVDYRSAGWRIPPVAQAELLWPRERLAEVSEQVFSCLEEASQEHAIGVFLELDGPNRLFFDPAPARDLCSELFAAHPGLALCIDTGRLALLARQHGGDPLAYTSRWLPYARHVHLHGAYWDRGENHLPPLPEHEDDRGYAPAAAVARMVLRSHLDALMVLETNPSGCPPDVISRSMRYCAAL